MAHPDTGAGGVMPGVFGDCPRRAWRAIHQSSVPGEARSDVMWGRGVRQQGYPGYPVGAQGGGGGGGGGVGGSST